MASLFSIKLQFFFWCVCVAILASRDYETLKQRVYLDSNNPRHCTVIEIIQNEIVTGPEPVFFAVGVFRLSAPSSVDVDETILTIKIVDDDSEYY